MSAVEIIRLIIAPFASNCYIVHRADHDEAIVIDPGGEGQTIIETLQQKRLKPTEILLTHGHLDHIMGITELVKTFNIPVYAHVDEQQLLQAAPMQAQMFGLPPVTAPRVDQWFHDGDLLQLIGLDFNVIHTPGHSPGGCCFLVDERVFSGDTLFESSIGRTDLPGGNSAELIKSIQSRLLVLPEEYPVYPGHGEETTIGREKRSNPFLQTGGGTAFQPS